MTTTVKQIEFEISGDVVITFTDDSTSTVIGTDTYTLQEPDNNNNVNVVNKRTTQVAVVLDFINTFDTGTIFVSGTNANSGVVMLNGDNGSGTNIIIDRTTSSLITMDPGIGFEEVPIIINNIDVSVSGNLLMTNTDDTAPVGGLFSNLVPTIEKRNFIINCKVEVEDLLQIGCEEDNTRNAGIMGCLDIGSETNEDGILISIDACTLKSNRIEIGNNYNSSRNAGFLSSNNINMSSLTNSVNIIGNTLEGTTYILIASPPDNLSAPENFNTNYNSGFLSANEVGEINQTDFTILFQNNTIVTEDMGLALMPEVQLIIGFPSRRINSNSVLISITEIYNNCILDVLNININIANEIIILESNISIINRQYYFIFNNSCIAIDRNRSNLTINDINVSAKNIICGNSIVKWVDNGVVNHEENAYYNSLILSLINNIDSFIQESIPISITNCNVNVEENILIQNNSTLYCNIQIISSSFATNLTISNCNTDINKGNLSINNHSSLIFHSESLRDFGSMRPNTYTLDSETTIENCTTTINNGDTSITSNSGLIFLLTLLHGKEIEVNQNSAELNSNLNISNCKLLCERGTINCSVSSCLLHLLRPVVFINDLYFEQEQTMLLKFEYTTTNCSINARNMILDSSSGVFNTGWNDADSSFVPIYYFIVSGYSARSPTPVTLLFNIQNTNIAISNNLELNGEYSSLISSNRANGFTFAQANDPILFDQYSNYNTISGSTINVSNNISLKGTYCSLLHTRREYIFKYSDAELDNLYGFWDELTIINNVVTCQNGDIIIADGPTNANNSGLISIGNFGGYAADDHFVSSLFKITCTDNNLIATTGSVISNSTDTKNTIIYINNYYANTVNNNIWEIGVDKGDVTINNCVVEFCKEVAIQGEPTITNDLEIEDYDDPNKRYISTDKFTELSVKSFANNQLTKLDCVTIDGCSIPDLGGELRGVAAFLSPTSEAGTGRSSSRSILRRTNFRKNVTIPCEFILNNFPNWNNNPGFVGSQSDRLLFMKLFAANKSYNVPKL